MIPQLQAGVDRPATGKRRPDGVRPWDRGVKKCMATLLVTALSGLKAKYSTVIDPGDRFWPFRTGDARFFTEIIA
jgi:hypothetical protein